MPAHPPHYFLNELASNEVGQTKGSRADISSRQDQHRLQAEELVEAVNHGSSLSRGLYVAFLGFTLFLLIIIGTTNDYNLLVQTPITLPLFGADVDLVGFYRYAPWAYFLAHVNLLMTIALLTRRLSTFHSKLSIQPFETRELLRSKLHVFAPIQYLSKQQTGVVKFILWIIAKGLLIIMPPVVLLLIQIDSLAMQDHTTVWFQRGALVADVCFSLLLWHQLLSGRARPLAEVRLPGGRRPATKRQRANVVTTGVIFSFILVISFLGATIPFSWLERKTAFIVKTDSFPPRFVSTSKQCSLENIDTIKNYPVNCNNPVSRALFDGIDKKPRAIRKQRKRHQACPIHDLNKTNSTSCSAPVKLEEQERLTASSNVDQLFSNNCRYANKWINWLPLCPFKGKRWLSKLSEQVPNQILTSNNLSAEAQNEIRSGILRHYLRSRDTNTKPSKSIKRTQINDGLVSTEVNIKSHLLSGSNVFSKKIVGVQLDNKSLIKANFQRVYLPKANLINSTLIAANFFEAELQGAALVGAKLQGVDFLSAQLQGANLDWGSLQGANLSKAQLQDSSLRKAKLWGANLYNTGLHNADLYGAELQGADLSRTNLQGATLLRSLLHGANLLETNLQGADLSKAQLNGATLDRANLQASNLTKTQMQATLISDSNMKSAVLFRTDISDAFLAFTYLDRRWKNVEGYIRKLNHSGLSTQLVKRIEKSIIENTNTAETQKISILGPCEILAPLGNTEVINKFSEKCGSNKTYLYEDEEKMRLEEALNQDDINTQDKITKEKVSKLTFENQYVKKMEYLCDHSKRNIKTSQYVVTSSMRPLFHLISPSKCSLDKDSAKNWNQNRSEIAVERIVQDISSYASDGEIKFIDCASSSLDVSSSECSKKILEKTDLLVENFLLTKE